MILWLCYVTERALPSSNRDTVSMHPSCPSFMTGLGFPAPTHQHQLLEAYMLNCLIQMPLLLCSFIGCPVLCPKSNFSPSLVRVGPSSLLYQLSPSCLSHTSGGGGGGCVREKITELKLIKFKNTQQIDS